MRTGCATVLVLAAISASSTGAAHARTLSLSCDNVSDAGRPIKTVVSISLGDSERPVTEGPVSEDSDIVTFRIKTRAVNYILKMSRPSGLRSINNGHPSQCSVVPPTDGWMRVRRP